MPKPHSTKGESNGRNQGSQKQRNGTSRSNEKSAKTKAILKIKRARKPELTIKATFQDAASNDVKELIYQWDDTDPKENLILLELQLLKLGKRYDLFQGDTWKILVQAGGRALSGRAGEVWEEEVENGDEPPRNTNTPELRREHFFKLVQKFNAKYLGKSAGDHQRDAMMEGKLTYEGHDHLAAAERLFQINEQIELLGPGIEKFSTREMARTIIPKNLKSKAKLKYHDKGGTHKTSRQDILDVVEEVTEYLDVEIEEERENRREQKVHGRNPKDKTNPRDRQSDDKASEEEETNEFRNPCRKHNGAHDWKDCPDNKFNKNRESQKEEVNATETQPKKTTFVIFSEEVEEEVSDEESVDSRKSRDSELWDIETVAENTDPELHPNTIMSFEDQKGKQKVLASCLLDQCCTGHGIITHELATALGYPIQESNEPVSYQTQAGVFESREVVKCKDVMLPCISTTDKFNIELNVVPVELSAHSIYGVIIGQKSMRTLKLNTDIIENVITWGKKKILMVPRGYWSADKMLHHSEKLKKESIKTKLLNESSKEAKQQKPECENVKAQSARANALPKYHMRSPTSVEELDSKVMGEKLANIKEISVSPISREACTANKNQDVIIAGLSYDHANFPPLGKVMTKYKPIEVHTIDIQEAYLHTPIYAQTHALHKDLFTLRPVKRTVTYDYCKYKK